MASLQSVPVPNDSFCVRRLAEETVILATMGDMIHVLDEMGTEIWQTIDGKRNLGEILDLICGQWEVERGVAESDLVSFMETLATKEIISLKDSA